VSFQGSTGRCTRTDPLASGLATLRAFLSTIGLRVRVSRGACGFIDGVRIERGTVLVDPDASISNLLHEAAHLAVMPARWRDVCGPDVDETIGRMHELERDLLLDAPDSPTARAMLQCGEAEAIAWSWAAGVHLGFAHETIVEDTDFGGEGKELRMGLALEYHFGVHGLQAAGFCSVRAGALAELRGLPAYPRLKRWLQD
jgi:hypothetical protein